MEISFCSHPNTNKVIATIFGTWHDSWAVVACAKFCCDVIISNWIRAKWNFHHIWIVMEKSLVKWVPEPMSSGGNASSCVMFDKWFLYFSNCCFGGYEIVKAQENFVDAGTVSIWRCNDISNGIPIIKITRFHNGLMFIKVIPIQFFYIKMDLWCHAHCWNA